VLTPLTMSLTVAEWTVHMVGYVLWRFNSVQKAFEYISVWIK